MQVDDLNFVGCTLDPCSHFFAIDCALAGQNGSIHIREQMECIYCLAGGMCREHIELAGFENQLPD